MGRTLAQTVFWISIALVGMLWLGRILHYAINFWLVVGVMLAMTLSYGYLVFTTLKKTPFLMAKLLVLIVFSVHWTLSQLHMIYAELTQILLICSFVILGIFYLLELFNRNKEQSVVSRLGDVLLRIAGIGIVLGTGMLIFNIDGALPVLTIGGIAGVISMLILVFGADEQTIN